MAGGVHVFKSSSKTNPPLQNGMQIKTITARRTFNDGNYENTIMECSADIAQGANVVDCFLECIHRINESRMKQLNEIQGVIQQ